MRKIASDGWPADKLIGCDLKNGKSEFPFIFKYVIYQLLLYTGSEFWEYGHELFKSTAESFPASFIAGDIFDSKILTPQRTSNVNLTPSSSQSQLGSLPALKSLSPLQGRVSVIHAGRLFHLFPEDKQERLGERLASLLSLERGSVIFGSHFGRRTRGFRQHHNGDWKVSEMFCHSPESWKEMWERIFRAGDSERASTGVRVEAYLSDIDDHIHSEWLTWSVTRL